MRERKNLIGVKQTLIWLERAVAERGADFNYRKHFGRDAATCKYREGNKPG